jgi:hypothetical protein
MAAQPLLNDDIERGRRTLAALDGAGLDIRAAFWVFDEASGDWRFTISEPTVDTTGTHALYERLASPLSGKPDVLPLRDVYVTSPDDPLVALVRIAISTPANANAGINFRGNAVMGTAVPDMYIFRMYRPPIAAVGP